MGYGYMWLTIPSPSYFADRYHGQCAYVFPSNEFCTARLEMADTARWLLRGIKKQSPSDSNGPLCSKFQSYRFSSEYRNTACPAGYVTSCAANAEHATGQLLPVGDGVRIELRACLGSWRSASCPGTLRLHYAR